MKFSLSILATLSILLTATTTHTLFKPVDHQRIQNYHHGYKKVFDATTPTVMFNKEECLRTPLPKENEYERIHLTVPFYLLNYVIELQRKPIYSNTKEPAFEYLEIHRGYQLSHAGKIAASITLLALASRTARHWLF